MNGYAAGPALPPKTNVMQVVFTLEMGGLETFVVNLVGKMDKFRYNLSVCCFREGGILRRDLESRGIEVHTVAKREGIDYTLPFRLARLFRARRTDIVHTHNPMPWLYGAAAARLAGVRAMVHTEHSTLFADRKKLMGAEKYLAGITDTVIGDSAAVTRHLMEREKIRPEKIRTVLNGIDVDAFSRAVDRAGKRRELGIASDGFVIGCVARLEPVKDHRTLVEAFARFVPQAPDAVLLFVGDGSRAADLKKQAEELGIAGSVVFAGTRTDIAGLLAAMDVFVLSSLSEGLPLSILEAMAAGKPVIATAVGGTPEVVVDGATGFLVPPRAPRRIAGALRVLYRDRQRVAAMGAAGLKRVEDRFNLAKMTREYERIYERVRKNAE